MSRVSAVIRVRFMACRCYGVLCKPVYRACAQRTHAAQAAPMEQRKQCLQLPDSDEESAQKSVEVP